MESLCEWATSQESKAYFMVCLPLHVGQMRSSFFPHRIRFALEGRRSYTDLIKSWFGVVPCGRCHFMGEFLQGVMPLSTLSLLRLLGCLLGPCGIFIQSNLIDDHVSFLFPFCFWPPLCNRWRIQSFAVSLSLPKYFLNLKALFGLICGFNNFPFRTRLCGWFHCLHGRVFVVL